MERTTSLRRRAAAQATVTEAKTRSKRTKRAVESASQIPQGLYMSMKIGARPYMEDAFGQHVNDKAIVCGVFDGHGGAQCSNFCSVRVCEEVAEHELIQTSPNQVIADVFTILDREFCETLGDSGAGSTATVAVIRRCKQPPSLKMNVGYVGDSSAMLIRADDSFEILTTNHHGSREDERERIENLGGSIVFDQEDKVYRVGGMLAVTRSLGDAYLKPYVSGNPEVKEVVVENSDVVVIGSDGLWDELSPETIIKTLRQHGLDRGVKKLVDKAAKVGEDNVCAVVIDIGAAVANNLVEQDVTPR